MNYTQPKILITNDDGIESSGLWALVFELQKWAQVTVVAPSEEQSATSLSITIRRPLTIQQYTLDSSLTSNSSAWSVTGTPADCIKTALSVILLEEIPDIVISGINRGSNAGKNVLYSGTVGGAIEAALRGFPAIAFSSYNMVDPAFDIYAPYTSHIIQYTLKNRPKKGVVLNVNFPCPQIVAQFDASKQIRGIKLVRQGKEYILEEPLIVEAPTITNSHHNTVFHMGVRLSAEEEDTNSDIYWLRQGFATCVPIFIDNLTCDDYIQREQATFNSLFSL